jgi:hypothetical protein
MEKHDGHDGLRVSGRQSVIPYVHRRVVMLLCVPHASVALA